MRARVAELNAVYDYVGAMNAGSHPCEVRYRKPRRRRPRSSSIRAYAPILKQAATDFSFHSISFVASKA
jgi:hypothetical protein